jgi:hypothetical protein
MPIPFIGGSYELKRKKADVQRSVNLMPTPIESGSGKSGQFLQSIPGLTEFSGLYVAPPLPGGYISSGSGYGVGGTGGSVPDVNTNPPSVRVGDLLNLFLQHKNTSVTVTLTGWTEAGSHAESSGFIKWRWFTRTADGSATDTSRNFVFSVDGTYFCYVLAVVRNVLTVIDTTNDIPPLGVSSSWRASGIDPPSVTFGSGANCMTFAVAHVFVYDGPSGSPPGYHIATIPSGYSSVGTAESDFVIGGNQDHMEQNVAYMQNTNSTENPGTFVGNGGGGLTGTGSVTIRMTYTP